MKNLKSIVAAAILALTLSVSAYAGDVSTPGVTVPPPPPPATCLTGDVQAPAAPEPTTAPEDIESPGFAVDILLALLSLF